MAKVSDPFHDPSNGLADTVFWRTLIILFIGCITGILDPVLNQLIHSSSYEDANWFSKIIMDITGPLPVAQFWRAISPMTFALSALIISFIPAFLLSLLTYFSAWSKEKEMQSGIGRQIN